MRAVPAFVAATSLLLTLGGCGLVLGVDPQGRDGGTGGDTGGFDAGDARPGDVGLDALPPDTGITDSTTGDAGDSAIPPDMTDLIFLGGQGFASDIAVHADGDVFITGSFEGSIDFGTGDVLTSPSEQRDCFIARLSPTLELRWARRFGGRGSETCLGIALDPRPSGGVLVVGSYEGHSILDAAGIVLPAIGGDEGFVSRWNENDGSFVWVRAITGGGEQVLSDVAVGAGGAVCSTGSTNGPTQLPRFLDSWSTGANSALLWCLPPDANLRGTLIRAAGGASRGRAVAVVGDTAYVGGDFAESVAFGLGETMVSTGATDGFVAAIDLESTAELWRYTLDGPGDARISSIATSPDGATFLAGAFSDRVYVDADQVSASGDEDGFLMALTADGSAGWFHAVGGAARDALVDVAYDAGFLTAGGTFAASLVIEGTPHTSAGAADGIAVAALASGAITGSGSFGGIGNDYVDAVALAGRNGYFAGIRTVAGVPHAWLLHVAAP